MSGKVNAFKNVRPVPHDPEEWIRNRDGASALDRETIAAPAPVTEPATEAPAEPMKRFTIDVTDTLHKRIKSACAMRGVKMADVIRELLEREFPKS